MEEGKLEPCISCAKSDLETILELQRQVCEHERFLNDLFIDLKDRKIREHIQYDVSNFTNPVLNCLRRILPHYD